MLQISPDAAQKIAERDLPPADDVLAHLGFAPSAGPGPSGEKGWLRGHEPWWDLRASQPLQILLEARGLPPDSLQDRAYQRVCFGDRERDRAPADLSHARFKGSTFDQVAFVNAPLEGVYLRNCIFASCDFRYTHLTGTTFQDSFFYDCDFYRAFFDAANVFTKATFTRVSLDKAWLVGMIGLTRQTFEANAMAQESNEEQYGRFLDATAADRPPNHPLSEALEDRLLDVATIYRALSGMWTDQGQLSEAGFAYVRCKTLERQYFSPIRRLKRRAASSDGGAHPTGDRIAPGHLAKWLGLLIAGAIANFGESMRRVSIWLGLLILVPALGLWAFGGVAFEDGESVGSPLRCLLFSFEQLTASVHHMHSTNSLVDLVGSLQFFGGVALLGLFGFTLANRLRNA